MRRALLALALLAACAPAPRVRYLDRSAIQVRPRPEYVQWYLTALACATDLARIDSSFTIRPNVPHPDDIEWVIVPTEREDRRFPFAVRSNGDTLYANGLTFSADSAHPRIVLSAALARSRELVIHESLHVIVNSAQEERVRANHTLEHGSPWGVCEYL